MCRWAYCPYSQRGEDEFHPLLIWSSDQGRTWSDPIEFPAPVDGNLGLTEATMVQVGPNRYVAAIRGDEGAGAWDAFYLSYSEDGLDWSAPEPTEAGERGRMPLFYHINNEYWLLSYREYVFPSTQYCTVRLSRDGLSWSDAHRFVDGVGANGFFVESNDQWHLFSNTYPGGQIVRLEVDLDALADQLLPIPGDADEDGKVTDADAAILAAHWQDGPGVTWSDGDFNGDGYVNDRDASILATHWQKGVEAAAAVPEPTVLVLFAAGLLLLPLRRKR